MKALELQQALQGKLSWHELIEPSILLARNGFIVSREFANEISKHTDYEKKFDSVHGGETFTRLNFSNTLELIAQHGADGSLKIFLIKSFLSICPVLVFVVFLFLYFYLENLCFLFIYF